MPNAKDAQAASNSAIFVFGTTGGGKTKQFTTLPGRSFAYLFDQNAIESLVGSDIDYEEFLPTTLKLNVNSLKKQGAKQTTSKLSTEEAYKAWEDHFEKHYEDGFFDQYDNILFDSMTTFSDMVMDEVLRINGREGQWPQQDDYGPQMAAITKVIRMLTSMNKRVYVTGHCELIKDELTNRVYNQLILTGKLKAKLPLLFSQIFYAYAEVENTQDKNVRYYLQTKPDRQTPLIRCTWGLDYRTDVTLDLSRDLVGQGLGAIVTKKLGALS